MKRPNRKKATRTDRPTLPELDQTKRSVLNSLASLQSRRSYQHAMDEFIDWYCSELLLGASPRTQPRRGTPISDAIGDAVARAGDHQCTPSCCPPTGLRSGRYRAIEFRVGCWHSAGEGCPATRSASRQLAYRRGGRKAPVGL